MRIGPHDLPQRRWHVRRADHQTRPMMRTSISKTIAGTLQAHRLGDGNATSNRKLRSCALAVAKAVIELSNRYLYWIVTDYVTSPGRQNHATGRLHPRNRRFSGSGSRGGPCRCSCWKPRGRLRRTSSRPRPHPRCSLHTRRSRCP